MTGTYATKLDGIAAGATNVTNTNQLTNGAGFVVATDYSYTGTGTGFTTSPTVTVTYTRIGNVVTMNLPGISATSNSTLMTVTGGPVTMRPATSKYVISIIEDNGVVKTSTAAISSTGEIVFYSDVFGGAFTASGTKAFATMSFSYTVV